MSLTFQKLTVKNWLVYGSFSIELPQVLPGKNLIVVNGNNGFGKTSFLKALEFVFHKASNDDISNSTLLDCWNRKARHENECELSVTLEFTCNDDTYTVSRSVVFRKTAARWNPKISTRLYKNGSNIEELQAEDKIQEIIPRECLEFFLFDGAEIARYAQMSQTKDVQKSIEKVLGIPAIGNLADDLGKVVVKLEDDLQTALDDQKAGRQLGMEISTLQTQTKLTLDEKKIIEDKIADLQKILDQLKSEYDSIDGMQAIVEQISEKSRRKAMIEERIKEYDETIRNGNTNVPGALVHNSLKQILEREVLKRKTQTIGTYESHLIFVLEKLLDEEQCLCGNDMDDKASERLSQLKNTLNARLSGYQGQEAWDERDLMQLQDLISSTTFSFDALAKAFSMRNQKYTELEEVETEIARLAEERRKFPDVDASEYESQISGIEDDISTQTTNLQSVCTRLKDTEEKLRDKERERDALGIAEGQTQGLTKKKQLADKLLLATKDFVKRMIETKRSEIEEKSSEIFNNITNKPAEYEKLKIRDGYAIQVLLRDGSTIENSQLSAGEKEVVAYSFITALNLASRNPAPFVMDTPFGHLDSKHRNGLLASLPELDVQVILLATDRDLPPDQRDVFDSHIAKEFNLIRNQNTSVTTIEEDNQ